MSIGWTIEVGYISGYTCDYDPSQAFKIVQDYALGLTTRPTWIVREVLEENGLIEEAEIKPLVDIYNEIDGNPLRIEEFGDEGSSPYIHILASGTDESRVMKEIVARAFVRLLLKYAHGQGFDLNITVV